MSNPQSKGPWLLIPDDKSIDVRSVDPEDLPRIPGEIVQVLTHGNKFPTIGTCRSIIQTARRWDTMSDVERKTLLIKDASTYTDLAGASVRVVGVKRNG